MASNELSPASSPPPASPPPGSSPPELDDRPPVLGSWRHIYAVVLGTLAMLVCLFWLLTRAYA